MNRFALIVVLCGLPLAAHNIPSDFTVQMTVRPEGRILRVEATVPQNILSAPDAMAEWFAGFTQLRENGVRLSPANSSIQTGTDNVTAVFNFPIHSSDSAFSVRTGIERHGVRCVTAVRFITPAGTVRAYALLDDSGDVVLDPSWYRAAGRFIVMGFFHILEGADHLLFLLCLVIPVRSVRRLIPVVTAFTVAHSITLIASASGLAPSARWFPPLVEALIAASIVYMAIENLVREPATARRWITAFSFGLVHGFGFSFALKQTLQFAGAHLLSSLLSFNVGVELGQIAALAVAIPILNTFRTRMFSVALSSLAAAIGAYWLWSRVALLSHYRLTQAEAAAILRGLIVLVAVAGAAWILDAFRRRQKLR